MKNVKMPTLADVKTRASGAEIVCPRKSNPFPGVVSAMACLTLHKSRPSACDAHYCTKFVNAQARAVEMGWDKSEPEVPPESTTRAEDDQCDAP